MAIVTNRGRCLTLHARNIIVRVLQDMRWIIWAAFTTFGRKTPLMFIFGSLLLEYNISDTWKRIMELR